MAVINIRKAQREGARLVLGLAGISGSGKTRSALELAYGLANFNAEKVGFLDTENRRGSLYADVLRDASGAVQQFWIGDLEPPFSPQRYIDAILEFQKAGVEVLVIDSISHEWEGQGGCEEIAHAGSPRNPRWNEAKREHKRFMNALLQSNMHVICCIRAREKVKQQRNSDGKLEIIPLGIMPVTEKNVMFEMTASLMMWDAGQSQQVMKCPEELLPILGREQGYLTANDGSALRSWIDGAKQLDPEVERARNIMRTACEGGLAAMQAEWGKLPKKAQKALKDDGTLESLKAAAAAFDEQRQQAASGDGAALDELNEQVLGNTAQAAE